MAIVNYDKRGYYINYIPSHIFATGINGPLYETTYGDPPDKMYKMYPFEFTYIAVTDAILGDTYHFERLPNIISVPEIFQSTSYKVDNHITQRVLVEDYRGRQAMVSRGMATYWMRDIDKGWYPDVGDDTDYVSAPFYGEKDLDGNGIIEGEKGECYWLVRDKITMVANYEDNNFERGRRDYRVTGKGGKFSYVTYDYGEYDPDDNYVTEGITENTLPVRTVHTVDLQDNTSGNNVITKEYSPIGWYRIIQDPDDGKGFYWIYSTYNVVDLERGDYLWYLPGHFQLFNYDSDAIYKVEIDYPDDMPADMKVKNGFYFNSYRWSDDKDNRDYTKGDRQLEFVQFMVPLHNGIYPVKYRIYADNGDSFEQTITYIVGDEGDGSLVRLITDYPSQVNRGGTYEVKITTFKKVPYGWDEPAWPTFTLPDGFTMTQKSVEDLGDQFLVYTYEMAVSDDATLGQVTVTTDVKSVDTVTDVIEVLGSTELIVEAPDEVEEETEYIVDVRYYYDGRDIQVTVPDGVNMIPGDTWLDEYTNIALQEYTLIVDEEYEEASFTLTVTDGQTIFTKEINVLEKEIIMPTISFSPSALDFVQAGESKTLAVTYTDTTTDYINNPYSSDMGVTIQKTTLVQNGTNVVGTYVVTVPSTIYATTIPLIFSCSSPQGASATATLVATQQGNSVDPGDTGAWITLDKTLAYVGAEGGTVFVRADFGFPVSGTGLSCRPRNANGVYPIAWCKGSVKGGYVEDDGTMGSEDWEFVMSPNEATESRTAVCAFSYVNAYGERASATLTIIQDAGEGEDVTQEPAEIVPYVSLIKMTAEGENYYGASTDYFNVNYFKVAERNAPSVNVNWFRITDSQIISESQFDVLVRYWYECDPNSSTTPRNAEITLSGTDDYGEALSAKVSVQQARTEIPEDGEEGEGYPTEPGVYIGQIWKDVAYSFGSLEKASYTIWKGNTRVFKGISWMRPATGENTILVNRICQNYLDVPYIREGVVATTVGYSVFTLRNEAGTETYATYKFVNAWNYDGEFRTGLLSYPILDRPFVVRGQMTPFSVFGAGEEVKVSYGVTYENYVDDFGNVSDGWASTDYVSDEIYHDFFPVSRRESDYISSVIIGNRVYQVEEPCQVRYVLYYLNPWGGLDWFPITGNYRMTDNITQYTYTRNYNNTTLDFGKSRYLAEIERKYTLTTGWLKQDESDRMWYLLESNLVYLHDMKEDRIIPVTIDDTTVEHKRKDRMNKIIQYTFTVTESQMRERI